MVPDRRRRRFDAAGRPGRQFGGAAARRGATLRRRRLQVAARSPALYLFFLYRVSGCLAQFELVFLGSIDPVSPRFVGGYRVLPSFT